MLLARSIPAKRPDFFAIPVNSAECIGDRLQTRVVYVFNGGAVVGFEVRNQVDPGGAEVL
jgi:hypothetical protein